MGLDMVDEISDNTSENKERLMAELKQAQKLRSNRQKALYDVADAAHKGLASKTDAVRIIKHADQQRFASAIKDLMNIK